MISVQAVRQFALSLQGTTEYDHFGRPAFRAGKRTYATLWIPQQRVMVKLTPVDQSVFSAFNPDVIYPVPNKWGLKGCTFFELKETRWDMLQDALTAAYQTATTKTSTKKQ